ncbi:hypothetical protein A6763_09765 [Aeromonas caviae]|nr:hypothetical protein A6763_09765 [Aeromonas caviae]
MDQIIIRLAPHQFDQVRHGPLMLIGAREADTEIAQHLSVIGRGPVRQRQHLCRRGGIAGQKEVIGKLQLQGNRFVRLCIQSAQHTTDRLLASLLQPVPMCLPIPSRRQSAHRPLLGPKMNTPPGGGVFIMAGCQVS